ncbi:MAG: hypothetical protein KKA19_03805 [Candidatus Margulisbacteria bacterium]|nr:hypothetical protein [Candidatus Margulisiibacteriota bacterium]
MGTNEINTNYPPINPYSNTNTGSNPNLSQKSQDRLNWFVEKAKNLYRDLFRTSKGEQQKVNDNTELLRNSLNITNIEPLPEVDPYYNFRNDLIQLNQNAIINGEKANKYNKEYNLHAVNPSPLQKDSTTYTLEPYSPWLYDPFVHIGEVKDYINNTHNQTRKEKEVLLKKYEDQPELKIGYNELLNDIPNNWFTPYFLVKTEFGAQPDYQNNRVVTTPEKINLKDDVRNKINGFSKDKILIHPDGKISMTAKMTEDDFYKELVEKTSLAEEKNAADKNPFTQNTYTALKELYDKSRTWQVPFLVEGNVALIFNQHWKFDLGGGLVNRDIPEWNINGSISYNNSFFKRSEYSDNWEVKFYNYFSSKEYFENPFNPIPRTKTGSIDHNYKTMTTSTSQTPVNRTLSISIPIPAALQTNNIVAEQVDFSLGSEALNWPIQVINTKLTNGVFASITTESIPSTTFSIYDPGNNDPVPSTYTLNFQVQVSNQVDGVWQTPYWASFCNYYLEKVQVGMQKGFKMRADISPNPATNAVPYTGTIFQTNYHTNDNPTNISFLINYNEKWQENTYVAQGTFNYSSFWDLGATIKKRAKIVLNHAFLSFSTAYKMITKKLMDDYDKNKAIDEAVEQIKNSVPEDQKASITREYVEKSLKISEVDKKTVIRNNEIKYIFGASDTIRFEQPLWSVFANGRVDFDINKNLDDKNSKHAFSLNTWKAGGGFTAFEFKDKFFNGIAGTFDYYNHYYYQYSQISTGLDARFTIGKVPFGLGSDYIFTLTERKKLEFNGVNAYLYLYIPEFSKRKLFKFFPIGNVQINVEYNFRIINTSYEHTGKVGVQVPIDLYFKKH